MNKNELEEIFSNLNIPYNEGISNDKNKNQYPRIVFWEFLWDPIIASVQEYNTNVTYQVSFFSNIQRHPKLIELKKILAEKGIFIKVQHEYVEKDRCWHSFFGIDVLENIG